MMHLTRVDLPAPFSPSSAWKEPAGMLTLTLSSAVIAPKRFVMLMASSDGALRRSSMGTIFPSYAIPSIGCRQVESRCHTCSLEGPLIRPFGPPSPQGEKGLWRAFVNTPPWQLSIIGPRNCPSPHRGEDVRP